MRFNKQISYQNNIRKRGKIDTNSAQGAIQKDNFNNLQTYYNRKNQKDSDQQLNNLRDRHLKIDGRGNQADITNALHMKNKTMSNISIIDRISERQNRMEEKYFNQEIK